MTNTEANTSDLTRLTVFVVPSAMNALNEAAGTSDDNRTDVVNRALVLYNTLTKLTAAGGGVLKFEDSGGREWAARLTPAVVAEVAGGLREQYKRRNTL